MARRKNGAIRILRIKKGDSLKSIYAKARQSFTASDLQRYAEIEDGVPAEEVLAKMELVHREVTRKRKRSGDRIR